MSLQTSNQALKRRPWFKWRKTLQLVLAAGLVGWGGYALTTNVRALGASNTVMSDGQTIEGQYPDLPPAVAKSVQSVVALQRLTSAASHRGLVASGVILNDHQVLTAGHATDDGGKVLSCTNISVDAPGYLTAAAASRVNALYGSAIYGESTDLALLSVKADGNFRSLPAVNIASAMPKPGDTVFFINYQPKADGTTRSPLQANASDPVIFSGVVIGRDARGLEVAAGGGQSYGHGDPETVLRKGASGGAVVNADGQLIGLSVSSESLQANRSSMYIAANYGVQLPDHQYQIANVQTLDSTILTRLQSSMTACAP